MLTPIWQSETIPYRTYTEILDGLTPEEWLALPIGIGPGHLYAGDMLDPGRLYGEELAIPDSIIFKKEGSGQGMQTITIHAMLNQIRWPSWNVTTFKFDSQTGKFLERIEANMSAFDQAWMDGACQAFDGSIWSTQILDVIEWAPDFQSIVQRYDISHFEDRIVPYQPVVDKMRDIIIMADDHSLPGICVYKLSTGELIRKFYGCYHVKYICPEDGTRIFVLGEVRLTKKYAIQLIDYEKGEVISSVGITFPPESTNLYAGLTPYLMGWDRLNRRLIIFFFTPDAPDGSCTARMYGYRFIPVSTYLSAPIPLKPVRKGRTVPVLTRVIGDLGEGISNKSVSISSSDSAIATPARSPIITDAAGYATCDVYCKEQGALNLNLSVTV